MLEATATLPFTSPNNPSLELPHIFDSTRNHSGAFLWQFGKCYRRIAVVLYRAAHFGAGKFRTFGTCSNICVRVPKLSRAAVSIQIGRRSCRKMLSSTRRGQTTLRLDAATTLGCGLIMNCCESSIMARADSKPSSTTPIGLPTTVIWNWPITRWGTSRQKRKAKARALVLASCSIVLALRC